MTITTVGYDLNPRTLLGLIMMMMMNLMMVLMMNMNSVVGILVVGLYTEGQIYKQKANED